MSEEEKDDFKFLDHSNYTKKLQQLCREQKYENVNVNPERTKKTISPHIKDEDDPYFRKKVDPIEENKPCTTTRSSDTNPETEKYFEELDFLVDMVTPKLSYVGIKKER